MLAGLVEWDTDSLWGWIESDSGLVVDSKEGTVDGEADAFVDNWLLSKREIEAQILKGQIGAETENLLVQARFEGWLHLQVDLLDQESKQPFLENRLDQVLSPWKSSSRYLDVRMGLIKSKFELVNDNLWRHWATSNFALGVQFELQVEVEVGELSIDVSMGVLDKEEPLGQVGLGGDVDFLDLEVDGV